MVMGEGAFLGFRQSLLLRTTFEDSGSTLDRGDQPHDGAGDRPPSYSGAVQFLSSASVITPASSARLVPRWRKATVDQGKSPVPAEEEASFD